MKIYLVRHGQTDHNLNNMYNREDEDLTNLGIDQAKELSKKIALIYYDIIISSPLKRTLHTANIINIKEKEIITDDKIKERDPGSLSGRPIEVTNREEYWNYYTKMQYGTSERITIFFERIKEFLDDLKTKKYNSVLIVGHSGVSKAFYGYFNGIPKDGRFLNLGLKNCEMIEYEL